jgi:hypothetical protein
MAFVRSLTKENRSRQLHERAGHAIPPDIDFICLVGTGEIIGDGLVSCASQWPADLQSQGIPAASIHVIHPLAVRCHEGIARIIAAVVEPNPRWNALRVAAVRARLLMPTIALNPAAAIP